MALVLDRRASKDDILELYLNDVYLGQRGSFAIHGVAEAARLYFGKDVSNVTLDEAATIAGIIQAPATLSPFSAPDRALERRGVVLKAMVDANFISSDAAARASKAPLAPVARALEAEAPYFVDFVGGLLSAQYPTLTQDTDPVDVYTSLERAPAASRPGRGAGGLTRATRCSHAGVAARTPQAALIALDPGPETSWRWSEALLQSIAIQPASGARRQPARSSSRWSPRGVRARGRGRIHLPDPRDARERRATTFAAGDTTWSPRTTKTNTTARSRCDALAMSRNAATVKVAEAAGYDRIAGLWRRIGGGTPPQAVRSRWACSGTTPLGIATAYTLFPNGGRRLEPRAILRWFAAKKSSRWSARRRARSPGRRPRDGHDAGVLSEGTRRLGPRLRVRARRRWQDGTTNDLQDAWFVGSRPSSLPSSGSGWMRIRPSGWRQPGGAPIWTLHDAPSRALIRRSRCPITSRSPRSTATPGRSREPGAFGWFAEAFLASTEPTHKCAKCISTSTPYNRQCDEPGSVRGVDRALEKGEEAALVTIVSAQGSSAAARRRGMLVFADGHEVEPSAGGCYENDAFWKARESLQSRKPQARPHDLTDDFAEESGLIAGADAGLHRAARADAEALHRRRRTRRIPPRAVGANGRVPDSRARRSRSLRTASGSRTPEIIVGSIPDGCTALTYGQCYVVILTRGHRHDLDALRTLAARDLRYLGLVAARPRSEGSMTPLLEEGCHTNACGASTRQSAWISCGPARRNRGRHPGRADRGAARQDRRSHVAAVSMRWDTRRPASEANRLAQSPAVQSTNRRVIP